MTADEKIILVIVFVFTVVSAIFFIRRVAVESIGEWQYMLRCAKARYDMLIKAKADILKSGGKEKDIRDIEELLNMEMKNIRNLEGVIKHHWGRKLVRKSDRSSFDRLPVYPV